jgi:hypothetical protein
MSIRQEKGHNIRGCHKRKALAASQSQAQASEPAAPGQPQSQAQASKATAQSQPQSQAQSQVAAAQSQPQKNTKQSEVNSVVIISIFNIVPQLA